jgi:hypothetical protein
MLQITLDVVFMLRDYARPAIAVLNLAATLADRCWIMDGDVVCG